jgi:hypothetical protein
MAVSETDIAIPRPILSICVSVALTVGVLAAGRGWFPDLQAASWWIATCINTHSLASLAGKV